MRENAAGFTTSHLVRKTRALALLCRELRRTLKNWEQRAQPRSRFHGNGKLASSSVHVKWRYTAVYANKARQAGLFCCCRHFWEEKSSLLLCLPNGCLVLYKSSLCLCRRMACSFVHSYVHDRSEEIEMNFLLTVSKKKRISYAHVKNYDFA